MRRRKNSKTLYAELDDIEFQLARARREQEEAYSARGTTLQRQLWTDSQWDRYFETTPAQGKELQYEIDSLLYQKERIEDELARQGKYKSNPKYRVGQKIGYVDPYTRSQLKGTISDIENDVYFVQDFGMYGSVTPVDEKDILGALDFQGYIIKDKPKRKKFLGLFNNPSSGDSLWEKGRSSGASFGIGFGAMQYKSRAHKEIFREVVDAIEFSSLKQKPKDRVVEVSVDPLSGLIIKFGPRSSLKSVKKLLNDLYRSPASPYIKWTVNEYNDSRKSLWQPIKDQYIHPKKSNPASRHALVHRGLKYAEERDWRNIRDDFDKMAQGGRPIAPDGFDARGKVYSGWDDEDFQAVYDVMEAYHYQEAPRYRKNPYGDDY